MSCPSAFNDRRKRELSDLAADNRERIAKLTTFLAFVAAGSGLLVYEGVFEKQYPLLWILIPLAVGAVVLLERLHRRKLRSIQIANISDYYDESAARLARDWDALDEGAEFADQHHPYSSDLDLFGHGSIFQLISSAQTQIARETLANWLKSFPELEEIRARQEAAAELRMRRDLPEAIAATSRTQASDIHPEFVKSWAGEDSAGFPGWAPLVAFALPLCLIAAPLLYWAGFLDVPNLIAAIEFIVAVEVIFAVFFRSRVKRVLDSLPALRVELSAMRELLRIMERENFSSSRLKKLADQFRRTGTGASDCIRRILRLITLVRQRDNEFFAYLSYCLLWGTQFSMAIERWRSRYGAHLVEWMSCLGEFEALLSISTYSYEHPADVIPELLPDGPLFNAEGIGHPLLDETTCVRNDFQLGDGVQFAIVSGSNMSGKSTFLRAIGLNAVLAYMGAPVRCARLRLSVLSIVAAIRVQDSLTDGLSRFQTEMARLRSMVETAGNVPVLFLSDEMMAGTNSHDRRIASEWVIRALILRGAVGAISTHDLALTELAENGMPGRNMYFQDSGDSGMLSFDYKLRCGVLKHSNALNIAHMLGIDVAAQKR
ncbi:MAG: MutS-related protein [Candidatus Acidiferrales bacterium]